jgi:hypothetical protein
MSYHKCQNLNSSLRKLTKNVEFKKMSVINRRGNAESNLNFCMTIFGKKEITAQKIQIFIFISLTLYGVLFISILYVQFSHFPSHLRYIQELPQISMITSFF